MLARGSWRAGTALLRRRCARPITVGSEGAITKVVDETNTALAMGSGNLKVFATPSMVALMEEAACKAIEAEVGDGSTTVGTAISTSHLAATTLGRSVRAVATVTEVLKDGKQIEFNIEAQDSTGANIGTASHTRFVVPAGRFLEKAAAREDVGFP